MPPITTEAIIAILGVLLGAGVTALINWRKAKPEIDNLEANERKTQAEAWVLLIQSYERRISQLNDRQSAQECRIKDLEDQRAARDQRIHELEAKIDQLELELEEWRAGRKKKPTGPLG